ncbi:MAG: FAD-binding oxidoreductase [bacterium]
MEELSFWGWGKKSEAPGEDELEYLAALIQEYFDVDPPEPEPAPSLESIDIPEPRVAIPDKLSEFSTQRRHHRALNTFGRGFPDLVRGFNGQFDPAPDMVIMPQTEDDIRRTMDWAQTKDAAVVPVGGGTNVVRATEPGAASEDVTIALNTRNMNSVKEIDNRSQTALIQAGATGPELEDQLGRSGFTLRHYPQSFEFSTLGGWIATRAGGHFATVETRIDDFINHTRTLTPSGAMETRSLPSSGAGPEPDSMMLGSEGTFGIITEATVRVRKEPEYRSRATVAFEDFSDGVRASRELARSSLNPSNARLLSQEEVLLYQLSDSITNLLFLGFESPSVPVESDLERATELCRNSGGRVTNKSVTSPENSDTRNDSESSWREAFFRGPYLFNGLIQLGMIVDTIETCCSWSQFEDMHQSIMSEANQIFDEIASGGFITCRFTHLYPEGPAPYYTLIAPGNDQARIKQWHKLKEALSSTISTHGGTITHHHAVGRVHKPWYEEETPEMYRESLSKVKTELDPDGMMNPGVLFDGTTD